MDLGLAGRKALFCTSSQELGHACARVAACTEPDILVNNAGPPTGVLAD